MTVLLVQLIGFIAARLSPDSLGVCIVFVTSGFPATRLPALFHNDTYIISAHLFYRNRIVNIDIIMIIFMPRVIGLHTRLGRPAHLLRVLAAVVFVCPRPVWLAATARSAVALGLAAIACNAIQRPFLWLRCSLRLRCGLRLRQPAFALLPARPHLSIASGT